MSENQLNAVVIGTKECEFVLLADITNNDAAYFYLICMISVTCVSSDYFDAHKNDGQNELASCASSMWD